MEYSDKVDQTIIKILSKNSRTLSKEIALELRKMGFDMHDRTVRKRIARLERTGVIKGYKVITDTPPEVKYKIILVKLKPSKSIALLKKSIHQSFKKNPQLLMTAETSGDWDLLIVSSDEDGTKELPDALGKISNEIKNYSVNVINFTSVNVETMSLLMLNKE